jgi:tetratricopeptide (TPR) repeat protein
MASVAASLARTAALVAVAEITTVPALASRESDALRARAAHEIYNLDNDRAIATYRQAIVADPGDAAAYRGLASAVWLAMTYRRGSMTVDDYLGRVNRSRRPPSDPPPDLAAAYREAIDRALTIARQQVRANPRDADAHYQVGAALGLQASYAATIEGRILAAFRAAREAYDEHERVLALDPRRKDAGFIVGAYRYIVAAFARPVRWVAYMAGFGGGRERGLRMVEEAAGYPGDNQVDARFTLVLLYNREKRYDDALRLLQGLREQFPRNRLLWVETGATNLRAGRSAEAARVLDEGLSRFASDDRPRLFGEDALWLFKRGVARAALGRTAEAEADLRKALALEGRAWVHGRVDLELGKLALKAGDRGRARQAFGRAVALCDADNDGATADEARRLLKQAR